MTTEEIETGLIELAYDLASFYSTNMLQNVVWNGAQELTPNQCVTALAEFVSDAQYLTTHRDIAAGVL